MKVKKNNKNRPLDHFFNKRVLCPACIIFHTHTEEFAANMFWALNNAPRRLTPAQRHSLTWEAAMQRYVLASYAFNQLICFGKIKCVFTRML